MKFTEKTIVAVLVLGLTLPLFMVQSRRDRSVNINQADSDSKVDVTAFNKAELEHLESLRQKEGQKRASKRKNSAAMQVDEMVSASAIEVDSNVTEKPREESTTSSCNVAVFWPHNYCSHALFNTDCQKSSFGGLKEHIARLDKAALVDAYRFVSQGDCMKATRSKYPAEAAEQDPAGEDAVGMLQLVQSKYKFIESKRNAIPEAWYGLSFHDLLHCEECKSQSATIRKALARKHAGRPPAFVVTLAPDDHASTSIATEFPSSSLNATATNSANEVHSNPLNGASKLKEGQQ